MRTLRRMGLSDVECVSLLQWACPRLGLEWRGFRRVRKQVCKRIARRMEALELMTVANYRERLLSVPAEWDELAAACRVTISRFYRDRVLFDALRFRFLPELARCAVEDGRGLRCWSAGCCSGEEPYTLALILRLEVARQAPGLTFAIVATDADPVVLERARRACYPSSALTELPKDWTSTAFRREQGEWRLRAEYREGVCLVEQDLRAALPAGPFDLILCRNLVYTYFAESWRRTLTQAFAERLRRGGLLVLGKNEGLPELLGLAEIDRRLPIFRRSSPS